MIVMFVRSESPVVWSIISGAYGLAFGFLCSLPYFVSGGLGGGMAYWVSGMYFDVVHCVANVIICLALYKPLHFILRKLEHVPANVSAGAQMR